MVSNRAARAAENAAPAPERDKESLNFKVSTDFKKEFKGFAVAEGISMTDLLKEGFELSKKNRRK